MSATAPSTSASTLSGLGLVWLLASRLAGLALLALTGWLAWRFPVASPTLELALGVYLLALLRWPHLWLVVLPALLPVLDLTPWSGWIFFTGFDLFILATLSAALLRGGLSLGGFSMGPGGWLLIGLLILWQIVATVRGVLPLPEITANALISYYSPVNGLRVLKGFVWVLLLLPLVGFERSRGVPVGLWFALGMLVALVTGSATILWERNLFTGLNNFTTEYRVTGMFSGMHTGGAYIDGFLVFVLPFVGACLIFWRDLRGLAAGMILFGLILYCLLVTFSRADYLALGVILAVLALGALIRARPAHTTALGLGALALVGTLVMVPVLSGSYIQSRFATTFEDLQVRLDHWSKAVAMMDPGLTTTLFGMGHGTFPRAYLWGNTLEAPPSTFNLLDEGGQTYARFGSSGRQGDLYLRQRLTLPRAGRYQIHLRLRTQQPQERFLVEFCQRNILQSYDECPWKGFDLTGEPGTWQEYNKSIDLKPSPSGLWGSRPQEIDLLNRGLKGPVDIGEVKLFAPDGEQLIRNPDFSQGLDHWFYSSGSHLDWHVKNVFVHVYFEGGLLGLGVFLALLGYLLWHLYRRTRHDDPLAPLLAAALAGLLAVGLFDSLFDEPRMTLLFFLGAWLAVARPDAWQPAPTPHTALTLEALRARLAGLNLAIPALASTPAAPRGGHTSRRPARRPPAALPAVAPPPDPQPPTASPPAAPSPETQPSGVRTSADRWTRLTLLLRPDQLDDLQKQAVADGISLSRTLRRLLEGALKELEQPMSPLYRTLEERTGGAQLAVGDEECVVNLRLSQSEDLAQLAEDLGIEVPAAVGLLVDEWLARWGQG